MIPLLFGTLISASFNLVVRWALARKANLLAVGAINYAAAALFYAVAVGLLARQPPSRETVAIGVGGGLVYVAAYFFLLPALRLRGVSVPSALVRLSVLVPIALSLAVWHEQPTAGQVTGMVLAVASLPLLSYRPGEGFSAGWREYGVLAGLFVLNGFCLTALKAFQEYAPAEERLQFLLLLFGTAAAVSAGVCVARGERVRARDWAPGLVLGACNVGGNLLLLFALQALPGVVVFPFNSSVGLLYTILVAHRLWGERMARLERAGIALAIGAVVLVVR